MINMYQEFNEKFQIKKCVTSIINGEPTLISKNEDIIPKPLQKSRKLAKDSFFPNLGNRIGSSISFNNTGSIISIGTDGTYFQFETYGLERAICLALLKAGDPSLCAHPNDPACSFSYSSIRHWRSPPQSKSYRP